MLDHNPKEAMFWAYELYHSGFEDYIFKLMLKIYNMFYIKDNSTLGAFVLKTTDEWRADKSQDHLLGSIVYTLTCRDCDGDDYAKQTQPRRRFIIKLKHDDVDIYRTIIMPPTENWKLLRIACVYPIRKNIREIFEHDTAAIDPEIYNSNAWLYYAVRSPIWEDRVLEFGGMLDDETQQIIFPDGDDDDTAERFYDHWGYEPDEQHVETKLKIMGNNWGQTNSETNRQTSFVDLCAFGVDKIEGTTALSSLSNTMIFCK